MAWKGQFSALLLLPAAPPPSLTSDASELDSRLCDASFKSSRMDGGSRRMDGSLLDLLRVMGNRVGTRKTEDKRGKEMADDWLQLTFLSRFLSLFQIVAAESLSREVIKEKPRQGNFHCVRYYPKGDQCVLPPLLLSSQPSRCSSPSLSTPLSSIQPTHPLRTVS